MSHCIVGSVSSSARRAKRVSALLSSAALALSANAAAGPIEVGDPVDVGATLDPADPPLAPNDPDEQRDDYAVAAGKTTVLATWVESFGQLYAALLDPSGSVVVPRFLVHETARLFSVRAVFTGDTYRIAVADVTNGYVGAQILSVSEAGAVVIDGEYGLANQGLVECQPAGLDHDGLLLIVPCEGGPIVSIAQNGDYQSIHWPSGSPHVEVGCRNGDCSAAFQQWPSGGALDRNVAVISLDDPTAEPSYVGYRDANESRMAVAKTEGGTLIVSRSFLMPPGDANGEAREHLHGFFLHPDATVTSIDGIVEMDEIRDPRLATNGASVALAYRVNGGPTGLTMLDTAGQPLGESVELSTTPSMDVRLAAAPAGAYVVAYDSGSRLLVRTVGQATPPSDAGASDAAAPEADASDDAPLPTGPAPQAGGDAASGCGCSLPGDRASPAAALGAVALLGAQALRRRSRRLVSRPARRRAR